MRAEGGDEGSELFSKGVDRECPEAIERAGMVVYSLDAQT